MGQGARFGRRGVRWRLLLAFFAICALAALAATASIYALSRLGSELSSIAQERMPAALISQEISQQAERIVAAAPGLLSLNSIAQQEEFSRGLADDIARLNQLLADLKGRLPEGAELDVIAKSVELLNINLISIDTAVYNNAVLTERKHTLLDELFELYTETRLLLTPAVLDREDIVLDIEDQLADPGLAADDRAELVAEQASLNRTLAQLTKSQLELLLVKNMLLEIASTKTADDLQTSAISVGWSLDSLEQLTEELDADLRGELQDKFDRFRALLSGADSIVAVRQQELKGIGSITDLLSKNAELSRGLTRTVGDLVAGLRRDVTAANAEALAVQQLSIKAVVGIVALSLLTAILIVWLYVSRNLIRRLTALSDSMLAIAGGDLEAPLPAAGGGDEIGHMAEALVVFRDTAVEVKKTNLREIQEARRRLVDAIESISEGFSLYDADDKLVVSNSTYSKLLYPGIEDVMRPGVPFETIIRTAAERGLVSGAENRLEEWVEERLAEHHNPGESHVQQQSDGRWILINERRTDDGGTVAVYADITEIKRREEELSAKSQALEQLSNQLAKYLSPQVYDSIFSGKQEVKVTSSRKKLTVFFSDIVGFTETADRLESEDLAQLLNHYLTEMSRIALDHGATIDKYVGDAILAFFGDPETRGVKEDALACVRMAIAHGHRHAPTHARPGNDLARFGRRKAAGGAHGHPHGLLHGRQFRQRGPHGLHHHRRRGEHRLAAAGAGPAGRDLHLIRDMGACEGRGAVRGARRDRGQGHRLSGGHLSGGRRARHGRCGATALPRGQPERQAGPRPCSDVGRRPQRGRCLAPSGAELPVSGRGHASLGNGRWSADRGNSRPAGGSSARQGIGQARKSLLETYTPMSRQTEVPPIFSLAAGRRRSCDRGFAAPRGPGHVLSPTPSAAAGRRSPCRRAGCGPCARRPARRRRW